MVILDFVVGCNLSVVAIFGIQKTKHLIFIVAVTLHHGDPRKQVYHDSNDELVTVQPRVQIVQCKNVPTSQLLKQVTLQLFTKLCLIWDRAVSFVSKVSLMVHFTIEFNLRCTLIRFILGTMLQCDHTRNVRNFYLSKASIARIAY